MKIDKLFMDGHIESCDETDLVIAKTGLVPEIVHDSKVVFDYVNACDDPVLRGKKTLYITENQGAVVRKCPGTSHYTCCDYTILHTGTFCTMDCSYCILQAYFHPPVLQYFVGKEKIAQELKTVFAKKEIFRIGTGEFTDSLMWERLSDMPQFLVKQFANQDNSILELKTKTVNIESLETIDHNNKTVIAWSMNTPRVISSEERGTASLSARLAAAKRCESWGYKLAFHFDPLVLYPGCEEEYRAVVEEIFNHVKPENILWISIGTFRFIPALKQIVEQRFPESTIAYGEFITGLDNKIRYFKPLRIALYQSIIRAIREKAPDVLLYFCMEDQEVWEESLGFFPAEEGDLKRMLDKSAVDHCGLNPSLLDQPCV